MSAFIALPSKSSGSATNTPASFRLGKQTKSSSRSVFPSFSHLRELSKPYIGSIGFPRERKNLCSEHWPPYRLFQLSTDSQRVNDLREFLYPANAILQFGIFPIAYVHLPKVDHSSSISLGDTWKVIVFRNWTDSNRIQVSRDLIMIYFTRSSSCLFILLIIDIKGRSLTINRIDTLIY